MNKLVELGGWMHRWKDEYWADGWVSGVLIGWLDICLNERMDR